MMKLSTSANTLVAAACVAFIYGVAFIGWRAWHVSRKFDSVAERLDSVAISLAKLARLQQDERDEAAQLAAAQLAALQSAPTMSIVFEKAEVFEPLPQRNEIGIGTFTVGNVGNDAVFLLGITRTAADDMPGGHGYLLRGHGNRDLSVRLNPGDPPLDREQVTLWYRDLRGRHWMRSMSAVRAVPVPDERLPTAVTDTVVRPVTGEQAARELPAAEADTAQNPGDQG